MAWVKRLIALTALAIVIYLFWPLVGQIRAAADLFQTAQWIWLPAIIAAQLLSYCFLTWLNLLSLQPFQGKVGFFRMMALLTSMAFIEVAVPSAGASGLVLRARLLGKLGYSFEASAFSLVLESFYLVIALALVGILGIVYMVQQGGLNPNNITTLVLSALLIVGMTFGGWRLINNYELSRRLVVAIGTLWNRYLKRIRLLDISDLEKRLSVFHNDLVQFRHISLWKFLLSAFGRILIDVFSLGMCFYLFGYWISLSTLFTGYGLMCLFSGLAALPGGLGLADASIPVIFARLGTPGSFALVAALGYRLLAFWFLRFVGFINWQILEVDHVHRSHTPTL